MVRAVRALSDRSPTRDRRDLRRGGRDRIVAYRHRQSLARPSGGRPAVSRPTGPGDAVGVRQEFGVRGRLAPVAGLERRLGDHRVVKQHAHRAGHAGTARRAAARARCRGDARHRGPRARATFSLAPGQPPRPGTRTALPGFLLAGDWIDTGLPGTIEGAVVSGHQAAAAALETSNPSQGRP